LSSLSSISSRLETQLSMTAHWITFSFCLIWLSCLLHYHMLSWYKEFWLPVRLLKMFSPYSKSRKESWDKEDKTFQNKRPSSTRNHAKSISKKLIVMPKLRNQRRSIKHPRNHQWFWRVRKVNNNHKRKRRKRRRMVKQDHIKTRSMMKID